MDKSIKVSEWHYNALVEAADAMRRKYKTALEMAIEEYIANHASELTTNTQNEYRGEGLS